MRLLLSSRGRVVAASADKAKVEAPITAGAGGFAADGYRWPGMAPRVVFDAAETQGPAVAVAMEGLNMTTLPLPPTTATLLPSTLQRAVDEQLPKLCGGDDRLLSLLRTRPDLIAALVATLGAPKARPELDAEATSAAAPPPDTKAAEQMLRRLTSASMLERKLYVLRAITPMQRLRVKLVETQLEREKATVEELTDSVRHLQQRRKRLLAAKRAAKAEAAAAAAAKAASPAASTATTKSAAPAAAEPSKAAQKSASASASRGRVRLTAPPSGPKAKETAVTRTR